MTWQKILTLLQQYYKTKFHIVEKVTEYIVLENIQSDDINESANEIVNVLQLVAGTITASVNKERLISNILALGPTEQQDLMLLIQGLIESYPSMIEQQHVQEQPYFQSNAILEKKIVQFQMQVKALQNELDEKKEEIVQLRIEKSSFAKRMEELIEQNIRTDAVNRRSLNSPLSPTSYRSLNTSISDSDDEEKAHSLVQKYEKELKVKEKRIQELQVQYAEVSQLITQNRDLRDEVDVARQQLVEMETLRKQNEKLSQMHSSTSGARHQFKVLEQQIVQIADKNMDLEDEVHSLRIVANQVPPLKHQIQELLLMNQLLSREAQEREEKIVELENGLQNTKSERDTHYEKLSELQGRLEQTVIVTVPAEADTELEAVNVELRVKMKQLERVNQRLKRQIEDTSNEEKELAELRTKELNLQIEKFNSIRNAQENDNIAELKKQVEQFMSLLDEERQLNKERCEKNAALQQEKSELEQVLSQYEIIVKQASKDKEEHNTLKQHSQKQSEEILALKAKLEKLEQEKAEESESKSVLVPLSAREVKKKPISTPAPTVSSSIDKKHGYYNFKDRVLIRSHEYKRKV
jgi:regulator of replication initiation timing